MIGAGVTGLACARALQANANDDIEVVVLDKARAPGGRMSTRRSPVGAFDHGASVLDPADAGGYDPGGVLEPFTVRVAGDPSPRPIGLVPVPSASAYPKALAEGTDVRVGVHVAPLDPPGPDGDFVLSDRDGAEVVRADRLVLTAPAPQVAELLEVAHPAMAGVAGGVGFAPCWSAMVAFGESLPGEVTAVLDAPALEWAIAERAKPGREPGERWVLRADKAWSTEHLEDDAGAVARALLDVFAAAVGPGLPEPVHVEAHRWRYARVETAVAAPVLFDPAMPTLVAGGDWCAPLGPGLRAGTVGAALASGGALAATILRARQA